MVREEVLSCFFSFSQLTAGVLPEQWNIVLKLYVRVREASAPPSANFLLIAHPPGCCQVNSCQSSKILNVNTF